MPSVKIITAAFDAGRDTKDFSFSVPDHDAEGQARARAQGAAYYQALGTAREDFYERRDAVRTNFSFFGAPHVALLFAPDAADNVSIAVHIGMDAQTSMLALVPTAWPVFHEDAGFLR